MQIYYLMLQVTACVLQIWWKRPRDFFFFFDLVLETQIMMLMMDEPFCQSGFLSFQHRKMLSSYFTPCSVSFISLFMSMICRRWFLIIVFVNPRCFVYSVTVRYTVWGLEKLSPKQKQGPARIIISVMKFPWQCSHSLRDHLFNTEFHFIMCRYVCCVCLFFLFWA